MLTKTALTLIAGFLLLPPAHLAAEVADSSAQGFTVKVTLDVQSSPDDVYRRLVRNIGDWWDASHSYSGDSHNLSIEDKPGGCFCEKLQNGGGVEHMKVINVMPGKRLVMSGALGPLQALAATGTLTVEFSPASRGTKMEVTYAVSGYLPAGMNTFASIVDGVITSQFTRLKNYAEHGDPAK